MLWDPRGVTGVASEGGVWGRPPVGSCVLQQRDMCSPGDPEGEGAQGRHLTSLLPVPVPAAASLTSPTRSQRVWELLTLPASHPGLRPGRAEGRWR